jgi:hypothetical protein
MAYRMRKVRVGYSRRRERATRLENLADEFGLDGAGRHLVAAASQLQ